MVNIRRKKKSAKGKAGEEPSGLDATRQEVLKKARTHVKPLHIARHKVLSLTAVILVVLVVLFMGFMTYLVYAKHSDNSLVYRVSRVVPYPVAKIDGRWVSYSDYLFEVRYRKNLYENPSSSSSQEPVDFESDEGKKLYASVQNAAIKQAKTKAVIKQLAAEHNVSVSSKELNEAVDELVQSQGGDKKFRNAIEQFYGWDMNDFRKEYRVQLLQQKLQLNYLPTISGEQRKTAEGVQARAAQGDDFAQLAKEFSQDPGSKDNGGDLGFISGQTPFVKEFKDAALALQPGQVSPVVQTQFGFHIIKAIEKKDNEMKIAHILINYAKDIESIINEKLEAAKGSDYIKLPEAPAEEQPQPAAS